MWVNIKSLLCLEYYRNKDIEFSLPQLRHSESYDELTRESPNHEECEVECESDAPPLLLDRTNHGQRSNSFSKLCSELRGGKYC